MQTRRERGDVKTGAEMGIPEAQSHVANKCKQPPELEARGRFFSKSPWTECDC